MPDFPFPTSLRPAQVDWQLVANTQTFESPLTRETQTAELPGARWMATLKFEKFKRSEIAVLESLIAKLRGQANRVLLWHHVRETPRGSALGAPLVNGAAQTGASLITDGWTASQLGALLDGDHFAVNGELKIVTADLDADVGGNATIQFEPPLRNAPADGAAISFNSATARFRLINDAQGKMTSRRALNATTLTFVEDVS